MPCPALSLNPTPSTPTRRAPVRQRGASTGLAGKLLAVGVALFIGTDLSHGAEPISIQEFAARMPQWDQLVGSTFNLEGRASFLSGRELRMRGVDLKFILTEDFPRPRSLLQVRLTGQLERDGRNLQFRVTSFGDWKSEAEMIRERLRASDANNPESYYTLARWVEERSKFYDDPALMEEARDLRRRGVVVAQNRAPFDRPDEFYALLDQAIRWKLPSELLMDVRHHAVWAELHREAARQQLPEYSAVLARIRADFPGAEQPREDIPAKLRADYLANPLATYSASDAETRTLLHRLLFTETVMRMLKQEARADGSNGDEVAAKADKLIPEHPEIAAALRARQSTWKEGRIPEMSRTEVLEYRNQLRAGGEPDKAAAMVRRWIEARLSGRRPGAQLYLDRAKDELDMVEDPRAALDLVSQAMQIDPDTPGAAELLARMGYGWHNGKAVLKELIPPPPPDPFLAAVEAGKIIVGMSDAQVRAAIGGAPETVVRLASQGGVTELWHYPSQRLTIYLEAARAHPNLRVTKFVETPEIK